MRLHLSVTAFGAEPNRSYLVYIPLLVTFIAAMCTSRLMKDSEWYKRHCVYIWSLMNALIMLCLSFTVPAIQDNVGVITAMIMLLIGLGTDRLLQSIPLPTTKLVVMFMLQASTILFLLAAMSNCSDVHQTKHH